MASLDQVAKAKPLLQNNSTSFSIDAYMFGAFGEVMVVATYIQIVAKIALLLINVLDNSSNLYYARLQNQIDESKLLLFFGIANAINFNYFVILTSTLLKETSALDSLQTLVYKALKLFIFFCIEYIELDFKSTRVFYSESRIVENKASLLSLNVE